MVLPKKLPEKNYKLKMWLFFTVYDDFISLPAVHGLSLSLKIKVIILD